MITLDTTNQRRDTWNPIEMKESDAIAEVHFRLERGEVSIPPEVVRRLLGGGKVN